MESTQESYILGHSEFETQRLMLQGSILRPITERFLTATGLGPGMCVLDVGAGAGDVALLAASIVGPGGSVTALDWDDRPLAMGRERQRRASVSNVEFVHGTLADLPKSGRFDLVIGRYVLAHQKDAADMMRRAGSFVARGGRLAFQEPFHPPGVLPGSFSPLWDKMWNDIHAAMRTLNGYACGPRLSQLFNGAGFGQPDLICEVPVSNGPNSPFLRWLAMTYQSLRPRLQQMGLVSAVDATDAKTLERLLQDEIEPRSQLTLSSQYCGWVAI